MQVTKRRCKILWEGKHDLAKVIHSFQTEKGGKVKKQTPTPVPKTIKKENIKNKSRYKHQNLEWLAVSPPQKKKAEHHNKAPRPLVSSVSCAFPKNKIKLSLPIRASFHLHVMWSSSSVSWARACRCRPCPCRQSWPVSWPSDHRPAVP